MKNPTSCEKTADCASVPNTSCGTLDLSGMVPKLEALKEQMKKSTEAQMNSGSLPAGFAD